MTLWTQVIYEFLVEHIDQLPPRTIIKTVRNGYTPYGWFIRYGEDYVEVMLQNGPFLMVGCNNDQLFIMSETARYNAPINTYNSEVLTKMLNNLLSILSHPCYV